MHDRDGGKFLPLDPDSLPLNGRSSGQGTAQRHSHGCPPKPYPIAAAQTKNRQYVRMIRNVYCGSGCSELNAAMQYFYHSLILRECAPQVSREILNIAICEMHHLELLGQLLCSMGSEPKFFASRCSPHGMQNVWWSAKPGGIVYAGELGPALQADVQLKTGIIENYCRITREISDPGIVQLAERILLDEEDHLRIFTALLQRFCG